MEGKREVPKQIERCDTTQKYKRYVVSRDSCLNK